MNTRIVAIVAILVAIAVIAAGTAWVIRSKAVNQAKIEMAGILSSLGNEIMNFHESVGEISPSVVGKTALQNELTRLKLKTESTNRKLTDIQRLADKSDLIYSLAVRDAIERGIKYITSCRDFCNQGITVRTLNTAAEEFFASFNAAKRNLVVTGSPTKSDASRIIDNMDKLVTNYAKAMKAKPVQTQAAVTYYPGWVNTASDQRVYVGIVEIAQQIQESRRFLGGKSGIDWSNGKNGNWSYFDQSWIKEILYNVIQQKKEQLRTVSLIVQREGSSELTDIASEMLQNSIQGLGAIYDRCDYGAFKSCNNRNDRLAAILANRYGIKAIGGY